MYVNRIMLGYYKIKKYLSNEYKKKAQSYTLAFVITMLRTNFAQSLSQKSTL